MHTTSNSKSTLRRQLRQRRQALGDRERGDAAHRIGSRLATMPALADSQHIASYLAADGEIDPTEGVSRLREEGKSIYLPVIRPDNSLLFAIWQEGDELLPNRFDIPEPPQPAPLHHARDLDAILMPLVAWDRRGLRLGMGGGFYDRSLEGAAQVLKIGLAFELQQVAALPAEPWDVALDYVVTESALYDCRAGQRG